MRAISTASATDAGDVADPGAGNHRGVLELLELHAQQHPLNPALSLLERGCWRRLSYLALAQRVRETAAWMAQRLPGTRHTVAVLGEPSPAWGIVALATAASGNVLVPLDPSAGRAALARMLDMVRPALMLTCARQRDLARALPTAAVELGDPLLESALPPPTGAARARADGVVPGADTAVMVFTSGTTGAPKLVEIGLESLEFQVRALTRCFALRPSDRLLSVLPLHHMLELTAGFLCPLSRGAQIHYLGSLLPGEALGEMRALGITRMVTVPAWLALLARELRRRFPEPAGARNALGPEFEHFVCGGAPLPAVVERYFADLGAPVLQGYGLTETAPVVATNTLRERCAGSVGRPLPGTEVRVDASGVILIRGPHVARRYHLDTGESVPVADPQGWLHSGDLGAVDVRGFLHVTGRTKSTIVLASGKNVQPEEIEACLGSRVEIAECGACALAGDRDDAGECVCVVVVPTAEFRASLRAAGGILADGVGGIVADAVAALPAYKRPRRVLVSDTPLTRTTSGKICRPALVALVARLAEDAS